MRTDIEQYWRELGLTIEAMPLGALHEAAETLLAARARGAAIFIIGNGGSAATASHFACDLAKGTQTPGQAPFRVIPLTDNMPLITAWGNDVSYEQVFAQQLATLARPGDLLVAISASGTSPNILAAARLARERGLTTLAFTGETGGKLRRLADQTIRVPSPSIEQVEDAHLMICHSVCVALRAHSRREAALATADRAVTPTVAAPVMGAVAGLAALEREGDASLAL